MNVEPQRKQSAKKPTDTNKESKPVNIQNPKKQGPAELTN